MDSKDIIEKYAFLVNDIYKECLAGGYTKEAAAGKLKYELEPMATLLKEENNLYFELCYLFAKEDLNESFQNVYVSLNESYRNIYPSLDDKSTDEDMLLFIERNFKFVTHNKSLLTKIDIIRKYAKTV